MSYILQNKSVPSEYAVFSATNISWCGDSWLILWEIACTDNMFDATKFDEEDEIIHTLYDAKLPEGDWQPVKLEDLL